MSFKQLMDNSIIKIENLNVKTEKTDILFDINVNIKKNSITCIVGPSGAGKSTLLRAIVGLTPITGSILFKNKISSDIGKHRKCTTFVPQIPISFPGSCYDNIAWGRTYWKLPVNKEIILEYFYLVGLPTDDVFIHKSAESLSVGQKQKLSLARALAIEPEVLLLDEPASALDAMSKESFETIIKNVKDSKTNITVVLISHDIQQVKRLADEVILLNEGKVIIQSKVEVFFSKLDSYSDADFLKELINK